MTTRRERLAAGRARRNARRRAYAKDGPPFFGAIPRDHYTIEGRHRAFGDLLVAFKRRWGWRGLAAVYIGAPLALAAASLVVHWVGELLRDWW